MSPAAPTLTAEQLTRWDAIASKPIPTGVGTPEDGLCVVARTVYALTGEVTDDLVCVSQVARVVLIYANDFLPSEYREMLGTAEVRDAFLATTPADDALLQYVVAEQARQSAIRALGYAGVTNDTVDALRACSPIVDDESARRAAWAAWAACAAAATYATYAAEAARDAARDAAEAAYAADAAKHAAKYAADAARCAADAARCAADAARCVADATDAATYATDAARYAADAAYAAYARYAPDAARDARYAEYRQRVADVRALLGLVAA